MPPHDDDDAPRAAAHARRQLRHYIGTLVFDAGVTPVRYVLEPRPRRLLLAAEPAVAALTEATLFVPEEREGALQALVSLAPADPRSPEAGALTDRWGAYHAGAASPKAWFWGTIEATKTGNEVVSGDELASAPPAPDALRAAEPRLCRHLNAARPALARACRAIAGVEVGSPVAVGVDPEGVDVRARFGIVRLEFDTPATDEAAAMDRLAALLARGGEA
jgi:hypothetical protein